MFMQGTFDDSANIDAINRYMSAQNPLTPAASKAKDEWRIWHDNLGWYDKTFPSVAVYDHARNLRNKFNVANTISAAEKAAVIAVQQMGLSSEELRGEPDRRLESGGYSEPRDKEPFFPLRVKIAAAAIGAALVAVTVVKKLYIDPLLPRR